jgi:hypothetical protein
MPNGRYNTLSHTPTRREPVGIDLFAEEINGTVQTTIYKRFRGGPPGERPDGGRVFARSVDPGEEHHDETVQAWTGEAEEDGLQVRDFRLSSTRRVQGACQLLSGAVGAIRAHTREADTTAAWIGETLDGVLTDGEKDVVRGALSDAPPGEKPEDDSAEEAPPIDAGSTWSDEAGPDFTVQVISVDEDGTPQLQIQEHTPEGRTLSVTAEDMRRRAAAGEIRRVG